MARATKIGPGYRTHYNVQENIQAINENDVDNNPTGGSVIGTGLEINWQDGPRAREDGSLKPANGAFIEDVLWAALQRLEFFNDGKYRSRANSLAITGVEQALQALKDRQLERSYRGVEGKHEV